VASGPTSPPSAPDTPAGGAAHHHKHGDTAGEEHRNRCADAQPPGYRPAVIGIRSARDGVRDRPGRHNAKVPRAAGLPGAASARSRMPD